MKPKAGDVTVESRPPIEDDSSRIAPGSRDTQAREIQFQSVSRDYMMSHFYGGRVHAPHYDNG